MLRRSLGVDKKKKSKSQPRPESITGGVVAVPTNDYVRLNVGGRVFLTARSTLSKESCSMLSRMFSSDWSSGLAKDDSGAYLIDRSPDFFEPVLNYLRTGQITINPNINVEGVFLEAKYFNIASMVEPLSKMVEMSKRDITRKEFVTLLLTAPSNSALRCQGLNLSGLDLSRLDLSNVNFKFCDLRYCDMSHCNLDGADLSKANLSHAILRGASMCGIIASGADFTRADLRGVDFEDPAGRRSNLGSCNFEEAILEDANLSSANCRAANFKLSTLKNANCRTVDFAAANLDSANLQGVNLFRANLKTANVSGTKFDVQSVSSR